MTMKIERIDSIPLLMSILSRMGVAEVIDSIFLSHGNWSGLSYGQLTVLFITYVLHSLTHHFSGMESWLNQHKTVIERSSGWDVVVKDASDDRLGRLSEVLGESNDTIEEFHIRMGQRLINAYELPTGVGRYDTTSFNVYHNIENRGKGILNFGHSKDKRPDLLQYKQGLAVLDPAGVPILSETLCGNIADDPCYLPAWRRMVKTIGSPEFVFIADCKAASCETRAAIDCEKGYYLFPLPMTGQIPREIEELVINQPELLQVIEVPDGADKRVVGKGFVVEKQISGHSGNEVEHQWTEQWMVTRSDAHAKRQEKSFTERIQKAEKKLAALNARKEESLDAFRTRAAKIVQDYKVERYIRFEVKESRTTSKKYLVRGRPYPDSPHQVVETRRFSLMFDRDCDAVDNFLLLAGWRVYVTNMSSDRMTLVQSTLYYRDEWLVERGFHRFKNGSIPVLPLFLRIPERIRGLMLLLTIALQVLTLIEFVSRKELSERQETLSGLVPGNPKMKTPRPTAERLLAQFDNLHLLMEEKGKDISGVVVEVLTSLQKKILALLKLPETIYDLSFKCEIKQEL